MVGSGVLQIREDDSTMALSVLNSLVEAYVKAPTDAKAAAVAMQALNAEYDLVEVVLASLEARACSLQRMRSPAAQAGHTSTSLTAHAVLAGLL